MAVRKLTANYDIVVVGGGLAGLFAAVAAARQGVRGAIVQSRSMFGGNASSEIRMHIVGADCHASKDNMRETGLIEELLLKLKEQYTIVIVTHNLFQARRIADDCIFLLNGQLWEQNTTEELFANPQKKETRDYLQGVYA